MSMPGSWSGWKGNVVGPNAARVPMPITPAPSQPSATQRSLNMIPEQPQPGQVAATLEHLTGRPADPGEVQQLLEDTQVTYGDYAPGGEVAQSGDGGRQVQ